MNLKILSSICAIALLTGCSIKNAWELDRPLEPRKKDKVVVYDEAPKTSGVSVGEEGFLSSLSKHTKRSPYEITKNDVIVEDVYGSSRPGIELLQEVAPAKFYNRRLGDIFKVLSSDFKETSLIYEPNVNPGIVLNISTGKMKLFDLMKNIAESAGYYVYYNPKKKAIIVSQFKEMKYYIPAGIFVDRKVDVSLGNTKGEGSGGASGSINLNADNPAQKLKEALDSLGSKDKIYSFDKDTGLLVLKEHPIFIDEITQFVYDFVKDRSRKFLVELVIVDIDLKSNRERTLDIAKALAQTGNFIIGGAVGGTGGLTISPHFNDLGSKNPNGVSIDSVLKLINAYTTSETVETSKSVVSNHSIKYVGNLNTREYVSKVSVNQKGDKNDILEIDYEKDTIKDGIQFTARVDAYNKKDYIDVSIAPILAFGKLELAGSKEGNNFFNKSQQVREMLSTASIKSGDIIITGGLLKNKENYSSVTDPLTEPFTPLGSKSMEKTKIETLFIVKVTELTDPSQTFSIPTKMGKNLAEENLKR